MTTTPVVEADRKLVEVLRSSGALDSNIAANRIEALTKERDEAVRHAGQCSLNACALDARDREAKKLRDEVEALTKERGEALRERDEARAAIPALEATVRHLETVYSQAKRDRDTALDTHNRMLGNVRGALGCEPGQGAVWKANELKKERDEARSAAHDTHTARAKWIRDVQEIRTHLGAYSHEDTFAAAKRIVRERDIARNERADALRTRDACAAERNEAHSEVPRIRAALGCIQFEPAEDAAKRVVRERDEARNAFARARNEASFQAAKSSALDLALRDIETERDALRLRYDALFAQSIHLAREVDRLNNEKADRVEAGAVELFPIGSIVQYAEDGRCARVAGHYEFQDGSKFLRVEIEAHGGTRTYHWRESLCRGST